jgi:hypothetical protein
MALPNKVLPGFTAALYAQPGAAPTPLTIAQLSLVASVSPLAVVGNLIPVEAIPAFGMDDAVASFSVAGSRQSDKIPVQAAPTSMTITAAWNPADTNLLLMRATEGANIVYYAFNGRVGQFQVDAAPGAEAKATFTVHPRGNQFGWSNNA